MRIYDGWLEAAATDEEETKVAWPWWCRVEARGGRGEGKEEEIRDLGMGSSACVRGPAEEEDEAREEERTGGLRC